MQVLTTAPSPHRYDTDGSGEIDKSELFEMCLTVGQVIATDCHRWPLIATDCEGAAVGQVALIARDYD